MASWHTLAPIFAVSATRESLVREILQQVQGEFHAILAIDDCWSSAFASILATRAEKPLSVASIVNSTTPNSARTLLAQHRIDDQRALQLRQDLSWNGLDVMICVAWISESAVIDALHMLLVSLGARTSAVVCIRMDRNADTMTLLDRFVIYGRSIPKKAAPAVQARPKSSKSRTRRCREFRHSQACANANEPCEDRIVCASNKELGVQLFAVLDGHGGPLAAQYLEENLLNRIVERLIARKHPRRLYVTADDVKRAISDGFAACDHELLSNARQNIYTSQPDAEQLLPPFPQAETEPVEAADVTPTRPKRTRKIAPVLPPSHPKVLLHHSARAGACAVVAVVLTHKDGKSTLITAHVGDCRAVIVCGLKEREQSLFHKRVSEDVSSQDSNKSTEVDSSDEDTMVQTGGSAPKRHKREADADVTDSVNSSSEEQDGPSVVVMTKDHTYEQESEAAAVRSRTSDPNPFRGSDNDYRRLGTSAPIRVAGSLAVTRAFGDAYLKDGALSCPPFQDGCPYITAEPEMSAFELSEQHQFIVLASDGLWDLVAPEDLPDIFYRFDWEDAVSPSEFDRASLADRLLKSTIERAALRQGISVAAMNRIPAGAKKREVHDDISILIVDLKSQRSTVSL